MQHIKLQIDGMHCGSCAAGIQMVLQNTEGVKSASASWNEKSSEVEFDESRVKLEDILKAIKDLGYIATPQN